jgi:hypothetical protein
MFHSVFGFESIKRQQIHSLDRILLKPMQKHTTGTIKSFQTAAYAGCKSICRGL